MKKKRNKHPLRPTDIIAFVLKEERRSGLLILLATLAATILANSQLSAGYFGLLGRTFTIGSVTLDIHHWINEALMAVFFLVVGLEVKRELIDGELRTWKKAAFPLYAAIGGMLMPAIIFATLNPSQPESSGWGIPMATDIAIAIGVLALLGTKIPKSLRIFLLSLAIIDDIGSIIVIGIFYNQPDNMFALLLAVVFGIVLLAVRKRKYWPFWFSALGLLILYCLLVAGISGTLAGVIAALLIPLTKSRSNQSSLQVAEFIESKLIPITSFVIVPLFVLANAGLRFEKISFSTPEGNTVFLGVVLGLLIGKPLGIFLSSWIVDKLGIADKPRNTTWPQIIGVGCIAGIGFTISLLITDLAYKSHPEFHSYSMLGIFLASILSAIIGLLILNRSKKTT
jgi:NhaA family Na+:H+ antiporter